MVVSEHSESKGVYFVYILRTASNTLYIGVTQALDERIDAHHPARGAEWTRVHPGAQVGYSESYPTLGLARKREIQLKKWLRDKKGGIDRFAFSAMSRPRSEYRWSRIRRRSKYAFDALSIRRFLRSARPRIPTSGDASTAIRARPPDPNHRDDEQCRDS
jgi:putative endonuclease